MNYQSRHLRELTNIKFKEKRKIKTSIQGSFTYRNPITLDKRFWNEETFSKGKKNLKKSLIQIAEISKENNIEFTDWGDIGVSGWHQIFFYDPDGNIIEVHQKI